MYWLAIHQEPVSLVELTEDTVTSAFKRLLPSAIKSLLQRSLVEKSGEYFFLQPVVMEHITQRFVERVSQERRDSLIQNIQTPISYSPLPNPYFDKSNSQRLQRENSQATPTATLYERQYALDYPSGLDVIEHSYQLNNS
jgi:hypothetical protein